MIELTEIEKKRFSLWIAQNIDERIVPNDEGNPDALIFNLIQAVNGSHERYSYRPYQDEFVEKLVNHEKNT